MDGGMREPGIETHGRGEGWDPRFDDLLMQAAAEEGLADDSLRALQIQLRCFNAWVLAREGRSWDRATADDLKAYFQEARELRSAATVRLKRWVVQRLYRWARSEGIIDVSFESALIAVRATPPMRLTTVPSVDQMQRILSLPDTGTPNGVRDRAALELLYGAGLRSAELLGLHVAQVPDAPGMRLMGKGAKERLVILGEHARYWIAQYKAVRRTPLGSGRAPCHGNKPAVRKYRDPSGLSIFPATKNGGPICGHGRPEPHAALTSACLCIASLPTQSTPQDHPTLTRSRASRHHDYLCVKAL